MNIPNIPTPNFSRRPLAEQAAAVDLIMDLIMNNPSTPEHLKLCARIPDAYTKLDKKLIVASKAFSTPAKDREENERLMPIRQEFLEYLQLMTAGLENFLATHPAPPEGSAGPESERP